MKHDTYGPAIILEQTKKMDHGSYDGCANVKGLLFYLLGFSRRSRGTQSDIANLNRAPLMPRRRRAPKLTSDTFHSFLLICVSPLFCLPLFFATRQAFIKQREKGSSLSSVFLPALSHQSSPLDEPEDTPLSPSSPSLLRPAFGG